MVDFKAPGLTIEKSYPDEKKSPGGVSYYGRSATKNKEEFGSIVVHHTAGTTFKSAYNTAFSDSSLKGRKYFTGYHFIVDTDGTIHQTAPMDVRTNHSTADLLGGVDSIFNNQSSIGVSFVGGAGLGARKLLLQEDPQFVPKGKQKESGLKLIKALMNEYSIPTSNIKSHYDTQSGKGHKEGNWIYESIEAGELSFNIPVRPDTFGDEREAQSNEQAAVAFRPDRDEPYRRSRQESNRPVSTGDNIRSFATRQFVSRAPGQTQERIEQALGPNLSELAPDIMSSLMTGTGIPLIQESTSRLVGKGVDERIEELRQIVSENPTVAQGIFEESGIELPLGLSFDQFLNELPSITKLQQMDDPKERLLFLYGRGRELDPESFPSVSEMLGNVNGKDVREQFQDALKKDFSVDALTLAQLLDPESYKLGRLNLIGLQDPVLEAAARGDEEGLIKLLERTISESTGMNKDRPEGFSTDVNTDFAFKPFIDENIGKFSSLPVSGFTEYVPTESRSAAEALLTGTSEDILSSSLTQEYLGENYESVKSILTGSERSIKSEISEIISDKSGLSKSSAYTLAYGGTEQAVKKLQSDSLDIAFDGLVESFPILGQVIDFFSKNQGILTLLGTLGGTLGLSALAGGGLTGGLLGGAGTMLGIRAVLGKEGYENFQSTIGEGASQAIGIFRDMFEKSGLADNEMIGPAIKGILNFAEENPVPTALGATGNIGAAFGSFLAEQGINIADNPDAMNALLGRFENTDFMETGGSTRSREALGISVRNANGGQSNNPQEFSPDMIPKTDSGPSSAEMRGTSGAMFETRAWANVDSDSGYGWPHGVVNV